MTVLFQNVPVSAGVASNPVTFGGGQRIATIRADNFGGGSLVIQSLSKNDQTPSRWADLVNGTFTANEQVRLNFTQPEQSFRVQLVGGTGATNVFVEIS